MTTNLLASCIYCREVRLARGMHTHVDRAHLGKTQYSTGHNGKYAILAARAAEARQIAEAEYLKNPKKCTGCSQILDFSNSKNQFCSHSCRATTLNNQRPSRSDQSRLLTRTKIVQYRAAHPNMCPVRPIITKCCEHCGDEFSTATTKRYCSTQCARQAAAVKSRKIRSALVNYRADCAFKFALNAFPEEFDFELVDQHGWYSAKNRGNNLTGVSRDHMVSVRWGFDNNIDPAIISHPANCKLLPHSQNSSKHSGCSITIEELMCRIKAWDQKYSINTKHLGDEPGLN